jgi:hypothetical protein
LDYELDTMPGAYFSNSMNFSEWFNDEAFEGGMEYLFEGCSSINLSHVLRSKPVAGNFH